jgi:HSP20 family molecular chaperone IbpA
MMNKLLITRRGMTTLNPMTVTSNLQRMIGDLWHEHFTQPTVATAALQKQQQPYQGLVAPNTAGMWDMMYNNPRSMMFPTSMLSPFSGLAEGSGATGVGGDGGPLSLLTDITESETEYILRSDACGMPKENIDVEIENDEYLILKGNREYTSEDATATTHRAERKFGSFKRRFKLPLNVDLKHSIDAHLSDGVLTVKLKKLEKGATPLPEHVRKVTLHD